MRLSHNASYIWPSRGGDFWESLRPSGFEAEWNGHDVSITVEYGVQSDEFPNSRGDIAYFSTEGGAQGTVHYGAAYSQDNWLRQFFFYAHGIGHFWQEATNDAAKDNIHRLIHRASNRLCRMSPSEVVETGNGPAPFERVFAMYEWEATFQGLKLLSPAAGYDLFRWFILFGLVDHTYHRMSVFEPFPSEPQGWIAVFETALKRVLNAAGDESPANYDAWQCDILSSGARERITGEQAVRLAALEARLIRPAYEAFQAQSPVQVIASPFVSWFLNASV